MPACSAIGLPCVTHFATQSSDSAAHTWPVLEMRMSMKSQIPPQRPAVQSLPRWTGSPAGLAVADTHVGFAESALVETTTVWSNARSFVFFGLVEDRNVTATRPAAPAATVTRLAPCTPGGAIIMGSPHVVPWSRDTDRNGRLCLPPHQP